MKNQQTVPSPVEVVAFEGKIGEERFFNYDDEFSIMVKRKGLYDIEVGIIPMLNEKYTSTVKIMCGGSTTDISMVTTNDAPVHVNWAMSTIVDRIVVGFIRKYGTSTVLFAFRRQQFSLNVFMDVFVFNDDKPVDMSAFFVQGTA